VVPASTVVVNTVVAGSSVVVGKTVVMVVGTVVGVVVSTVVVGAVAVVAFGTTTTPLNFSSMVNDPVDTLAEKLFVLVSNTPTASA
jgi:hypothetical protein